MNTFSLTPWPPPMSPLSFFPQVSLLPKKMLLAVFLNIFHGFLLQLTPWSCSKFLILASSAHNDSFQYICCILSVYLSHVHDLEQAHQKSSTQTYSRKGPFKSSSLWKLQSKLTIPILLVSKTLQIMCIDTVLHPHHTQSVYIKVWHFTFFISILQSRNQIFSSSYAT